MSNLDESGNYEDDDFEDYDDEEFEDSDDEDGSSLYLNANVGSTGSTNGHQRHTHSPRSNKEAKVNVKNETKHSSTLKRESKLSVDTKESYATRKLVGLSPTRGSGPNRERFERIDRIKEKIELSTVSFSLFDLPPVNAFDLYMRSVQSSRIKIGSNQTGDDNVNVRVQTDKSEVRNQNCQVPEDLGKQTVQYSNSVVKKGRPSIESDDSLSVMLRRTAAVVEVILEENLAASDAVQPAVCVPGSKFSAGCVFFGTNTRSSESKAENSENLKSSKNAEKCFELNCSKLVENRIISDVAFSYSSVHTFITAYPPKNNCSGSLKQFRFSSFIFVWDLNLPKSPTKILLCHGSITCCAFSNSESSSNIVLAGTLEGAVLIWDLRESRSLHISEASQQLNLRCGLRRPTYSTYNHLHGSHDSSLVRVWSLDSIAKTVPLTCEKMYLETIKNNQEKRLRNYNEEEKKSNSDLNFKQSNISKLRRKRKKNINFQIASLDDRGGLIIWSLVDVGKSKNSISINDDNFLSAEGTQFASMSPKARARISNESKSSGDLGMGVNGCKLKLIKTAVLFSKMPLGISHKRNTSGLGVNDVIGIGTGLGIAGDELGAPKLEIGPNCNDFVFFPTDPSRYLIATSTGILRFSRFGEKNSKNGEVPREYIRYDIIDNVTGKKLGFQNSDAAATCIAFSPFLPKHFLAGYSNGDVSLFHINHAKSLMTWRGENRAKKFDFSQSLKIVKIVWSPLRPAVFYILDSKSNIIIFDLLQNAEQPIADESLSHENEKVVSIAHSCGGAAPRTRGPSLVCVGSKGNVWFHKLPFLFDAQSGYDDNGMFQRQGSEVEDVVDILKSFPLPVYRNLSQNGSSSK
eukprot:g815.t1